MNSNLRAYLVLCAVFLLGSLAGAGAMYASGRRLHGHPGDGQRGHQHVERRVAALSRHLQLSSEQTVQITAILERQREPRSKLMHETMERCGEPLRKLRATTDAEIRTHLNPAQQPQFDELVRNHESGLR